MNRADGAPAAFETSDKPERFPIRIGDEILPPVRY